MGISNLIFLVITVAVMGFFALNLKKNWQRITTTGKGFDEDRTENPVQRIIFMLVGGLLQKRMFKEPVAGIMHFMIFWGFMTVSLGTAETILNGIFPSFNFSFFLGEGFFYKAYLTSQDLGNFAVVCAITFAILPRLFLLQTEAVAKASKIGHIFCWSSILGLVATTLIYMGSRLIASPRILRRVLLSPNVLLSSVDLLVYRLMQVG